MNMSLLHLSPAREKGISKDADTMIDIPYFQAANTDESRKLGGKFDSKISPQEYQQLVKDGKIKGIDCSGLVWYLFGRQNIELSYKDALSGSQSLYANSETTSEWMIHIGDLVFKKKNDIICHVGIVTHILPDIYITEAEGWYEKVVKRKFDDFKNVKSEKAAQYAGLRRLVREAMSVIV